MHRGEGRAAARWAVAGLLAIGAVAVAGAVRAIPAGATTTQGDLIVSYAASQAGVAYCEGGGGINGPSHGSGDADGCAGTTKGYDCMSLVQYAVYQATGIALPGDGSQLPGVGQEIPPSDTADLEPGDAVFWGGSSINGFAHSGIYAGNGEVWDAIGVGVPVQEHSMSYLRTIYSYDGAMRFWSLSPNLPAPVVGMAANLAGNGYWLADASGQVSTHGAVASLGSLAGRPLAAPVAHIVATPDGKGYWLVARDGGVFAFGDATFYGSMGGQPLVAPVVGLAPTPDGRGYWLVAADGGVFAFGDARFAGSMGGRTLIAPVVGMAADPATGGYWLVAADGGIFAFGAPFAGSTGGRALDAPIIQMVASADGGGYLFVASDGGVFAFGDAGFRGSAGGLALQAPIVGLALDRSNGGYWLAAADGGVFAYGGAPFLGAD